MTGAGRSARRSEVLASDEQGNPGEDSVSEVLRQFREYERQMEVALDDGQWQELAKLAAQQLSSLRDKIASQMQAKEQPQGDIQLLLDATERLRNRIEQRRQEIAGSLLNRREARSARNAYGEIDQLR